MTQEALNIAGQCRATASSPLAKNILVDEGNGLLTELLLDAARIIEALAQPEQEPVAWATREDFYRELDRSVNRMRQQMEIKGVVMRYADYDIALPVIDIRDGHVLVGQVTTPPQPEPVIDKSAAIRIATSLGWTPKRKPLSDEEISNLWDGHVVPVFGKNGINPIVFARAIEAAHGIKENT